MTKKSPYAEGSYKRHATRLILWNTAAVYAALVDVVDLYAAGRLTKAQAVTLMHRRAVAALGSDRIPYDGYKLSRAAVRDFLNERLGELA